MENLARMHPTALELRLGNSGHGDNGIIATMIITTMMVAMMDRNEIRDLAEEKPAIRGITRATTCLRHLHSETSGSV